MDPKKEGMCIVFEGDSRRFVEFLENADQILAGERFRSITSDNREMYECNVCGENGCTIRYNSNFFTLHEDCKEQFIEDVRSFLEEHSQTVVSEAI